MAMNILTLIIVCLINSLMINIIGQKLDINPIVVWIVSILTGGFIGWNWNSIYGLWSKE